MNSKKKWITTKSPAASERMRRALGRRGVGFASALVLFLCLSPVPSSSQEFLPSWFLDPPAGRFVQVFAASEEAAKRDGARILATYERSFVWGDFQSFFDPTIDSEQWTNADYYYYVDEDAVSSLRSRIAVADSVLASVFPRMRLYLLGVDAGIQAPVQNVNTAGIPRPEWTKQSGFERDKSLYGVGTCSVAGSLPAVWIKAEEEAVFALLTFQSLRIGSITTGSVGQGGDSLTHMELIRLKYKMEGLRVIHRWLDASGDRVYVLVTAPSESIRRVYE
jgi:hypothetical protein